MKAKNKQLLVGLLILISTVVNSGCQGGALLQLLQPVTTALSSILSSSSSSSMGSDQQSSQSNQSTTGNDLLNSTLSFSSQMATQLTSQTLQNLPKGPQDVLGTSTRLASAPLQLLSTVSTKEDSKI